MLQQKFAVWDPDVQGCRIVRVLRKRATYNNRFHPELHALYCVNSDNSGRDAKAAYFLVPSRSAMK